MLSEPATTPAVADFLDGYSLEITPADLPGLEQARPLLPAGTCIAVPHLPAETASARIEAAAAIRRLGFVPIPHISARRLRSEEELRQFLSAATGEAGVESILVIAGDHEKPLGPYPDALAVIRSGLLARHGIRKVGISGHPEGHARIPEATLWQALHAKRAAAEQLGVAVEFVTQFSFDPSPSLAWLARLRQEGVSNPVRLGIPGPASVGTLLRFAARCGVSASARVLSRYGASIARLLSTAAPDTLVRDLASRLSPAVHGEVHAHLFPFGGVVRSAQWAEQQRCKPAARLHHTAALGSRQTQRQ